VADNGVFGVLGSDKNGERHSLEARGTEYGGVVKWRELENVQGVWTMSHDAGFELVGLE